MKDIEFLNRIKSAILSKEPGAEVYLFGSRARGNNSADSDWDILVLTPKNKVTIDYELELHDPVFNLELETGQVISLIIYPTKEWNDRKSSTPLFTNVRNEGILL